jgi:hypothetical protein
MAQLLSLPVRERCGGIIAVGYKGVIGVMEERRALRITFLLSSGERESFDLLGMHLHD